MPHRVAPDPKSPGKFAVFDGDEVVEEGLASEGEAKQVADMLDAMGG